MSEDRIASAVEHLLSASTRRRPLEGLPEDCRPCDLAEAYAVQERFVSRLGRPVGYKIGYTNPAIQRRFGLEHPVSGRLLEGRVLESGAELPAPARLTVAVEPEFAFELSRGLVPEAGPFGAPQLLDAIGSVRPALEIVECRFTDWQKIGPLLTVADNVLGSHLVLGRPSARFEYEGLAAQEVIAQVDGVERTRGRGANVLGNPVDALLWLANHLAERGLSLAAGAVVTTGCVTEVIEARPGMRVDASHGPFGEVSVRFAA